MNTTLTTRIARNAASILASALITFTGLHLIADYALPSAPAPAAVNLAVAHTAPAR
jgi:hypothetical protein